METKHCLEIILNSSALENGHGKTSSKVHNRLKFGNHIVLVTDNVVRLFLLYVQ